MKVSDRQSLTEKGHLNFDKCCAFLQAHKKPFGDAGRHTKPSLIHKRPCGISGRGGNDDFTPKTLSFMEANLHLFEKKIKNKIKYSTEFSTKPAES